MANYRNFKLATYFVAHGTQHTTEEKLNEDLAFFEKHMRLDKVYLEPYRGLFADAEHTEMCKRVFKEHGIEVAGGITTVIDTPEGDEPKKRVFGTFCYNDPKMTKKLVDVSTFMGQHFDQFILDDFYFTSCTCAACREGKEAFNRANGITDGSWQGYRLQLMKEVSEKYIIGPAKAVNPNVHIIIKYPNWAESYQETGYAPGLQRDIFDSIYTGTETRDAYHQDQHFPRYLSFSLMTYFENMCPGRNGGGWFDPFDMYITEHYLEQAYLTAFSKGKELMMFCFQALCGSMNIPALGFQLDRLDKVMDHAGTPKGIQCYLPDNCRGEDNIQDYLGQCGLPVICTPYFPADAEMILLTRSSACDPDVVAKVEQYVANGGKAIATTGFIAATQSRGIACMTGVKMEGRHITADEYMTEQIGHRGWRMEYSAAKRAVGWPVPEFSNNASWALIKAMCGKESYAVLLKDDYGKGTFYTLSVPDEFPALYTLPKNVLTRLHAEFPVERVYLENEGMVSLFVYDNNTFIPYAYVDSEAHPQNIRVHVTGKAEQLTEAVSGRVLKPVETNDRETIFEMNLTPGDYRIWQIG